MSDDLIKRAKMALHDMNGRVEAGKAAMFEKTIDLAEAQAARIRELEAAQGVVVKPLGGPEHGDYTQLVVPAVFCKSAIGGGGFWKIKDVDGNCVLLALDTPALTRALAGQGGE